MNEQEKNDLIKQFNSLPIEVQKAISSVDFSSKIQNIAKNQKLMLDQAGKLEMETMLVLLGLEPLDKFVDNIVAHVGLSSANASLVAHDVNELIFINIREAIKQVHSEMIEADQYSEDETANQDVIGDENEETKTEINKLPEIAPKIPLPMVTSFQEKKLEPIHQNIVPVENVVESKLNDTVITQSQNIVVEEKTKLPEIKSKITDPYKEPLI